MASVFAFIAKLLNDECPFSTSQIHRHLSLSLSFIAFLAKITSFPCVTKLIAYF